MNKTCLVLLLLCACGREAEPIDVTVLITEELRYSAPGLAYVDTSWELPTSGVVVDRGALTQALPRGLRPIERRLVRSCKEGRLECSAQLDQQSLISIDSVAAVAGDTVVVHSSRYQVHADREICDAALVTQYVRRGQRWQRVAAVEGVC